MPPLPLVSAVIPTRNRADLVVRAVRSVLTQTYPAMEVLVVIDGEDKITEAPLYAIGDARIRVLSLREHVGAAEARNAGIRESRGEWIALLDDDDEWLPDKIGKQMELARSLDAQFPIVSCRLRVQTPVREYIWPRRIPAPGEPVSEYILARRGLFQGEGLVQTSALLARRELLLRVPFTRLQRRHQEWDWIFRATRIQGAELCFVDEPLAVWHVEENRDGISATNHWRYSYEWIETMRPLVTPRAYSAFLLTVVASLAARSGERRSCFTILKQAIRNGRPKPIDLFLFCGMLAIPQNYRRRLRALFVR